MFVVVSDVGVSANAGVNVRRLETEAVELLDAFAAVLLDFELDLVVVVVDVDVDVEFVELEIVFF